MSVYFRRKIFRAVNCGNRERNDIPMNETGTNSHFIWQILCALVSQLQMCAKKID